MALSFSICSTKFLFLLLLLSAIPLAIIISFETSTPSTHVYRYHSTGWLRECAKWDDLNRRFLVSSFEGGLSEIRVPEGESNATLEEVPVVRDVDVAGNASLGIVIDRPRNRVLVVNSDVFGNRYSALAAYDLSTWRRLFLTKLNGPGDKKSFADDVAVDSQGNAYVTDTATNKIFKVGENGEFLTTITSPLFTQKEWYKNLVGLNGIVHHPNGYLIVVHTFSGNLFKVEINNANKVKQIGVEGGPLLLGDGIELLSPTKLVVAGNPTRLVESTDDWETAVAVGKFWGPIHRLTTAAMVKDGKVYLNHMFGLGYPRRKHVIVEANFS